MRRGAVAALLLLVLGLPACVTQPQLGAGIHVTPRGVTVAPSVSGRIGGARVAVSP